MYYKELKALCDSEGWATDHLLVQLQLERAREESTKMAGMMKWKKQLDNKVSDKVLDGMDNWIAEHDEKRVGSMFDALDMAKVSNGLGDNMDKYLKTVWKKSGMTIPKIGVSE